MSFEIKQGLFKLGIIDYHAILGIPIDADAREIRLRYLKIVPKLHPDTFKGKAEKEKEYANNLLSRLVNPAYEQLSKDKLRAEHQLLLSQKAKYLAKEGSKKITLSSEAAKALAKAGSKLDPIYHKLINALAMDQYRELDKVIEKIAQMSEINLVYLVFKVVQKQTKPPIQKNTVVNDQSKQTGNKVSITISEPEITGNLNQAEDSQISSLEACIRRAKDYRSKHKLKEAILELRDVLKIEPNNSACQGLLGLIYLEQQNLTMAKIYINKAWQSNPQDTIVIEAKEALDKHTKETNKKPEKSSTSFISRLFGSKKK